MPALRLVLSFSLLILVFVFFIGSVGANTSETVTHSSKTDFETGSPDSSVDLDSEPGNLRLAGGTQSSSPNLLFGDSPNKDVKFDGDSIELANYSFNYGEEILDSNRRAHHSFLDKDTGYLYVSTDTGGVFVIDTADDTVVNRYYTGSTPALASNSIMHSFLDSDLQYLFISTNTGLYIIDVAGNTLVNRYHTGSTPALANNLVMRSFLEEVSGHLYLSTAAGLYIIDIEENIIVDRYYDGSNPQISSHFIFSSFIDSNTGFLYVNANSGLYIIDPDEDILIKRYYQLSTPSIEGGLVYHSFRDPVTGYLYVSTNEGLEVIDPVEDIIVDRYDTDSDPALRGTPVRHSFLNPVTGNLFMSTITGLYIIDIDQNVILDHFHTKSAPPLAEVDDVNHAYLNTDNGYLYLSLEGGGVTVIDVDSLNSDGAYVSEISIENTQVESLSWENVLPAGTNVSLEYRLGQGDLLLDNFDSDEIITYVGDHYNWGDTPFDTVSRENETLKLSYSEPGGYFWLAFWLDMQRPEDHFPAGTKVQAMVRFNRVSNSESVYMYVFTDDWEDASDESSLANEWQLLEFTVENQPFSRIGFYMGMIASSEWMPQDSFEIDWIKTITPVAWGDWSDPCETSEGCIIDQAEFEGNQILQYRLNLSTEDDTQTPVITNTTISSGGGFNSSGEYISVVIDGGADYVLWDDFSADTTTPAGTNIEFYTRTGKTSIPDSSWSNWQKINSPIQSPNDRYIQYKVVLTTSDSSVSPTLHSVSISYSHDIFRPNKQNGINGKVFQINTINGEGYGDNRTIRTDDQKPTVRFTRSTDHVSGLDYYQIRLYSTDTLGRKSGREYVWIDDIPDQPATNPERIRYRPGHNIKYRGDTIVVEQTTGHKYELENGTYFMRVRVFDKAGNSRTTDEIRLIIDEKYTEEFKTSTQLGRTPLAPDVRLVLTHIGNIANAGIYERFYYTSPHVIFRGAIDPVHAGYDIQIVVNGIELGRQKTQEDGTYAIPVLMPVAPNQNVEIGVASLDTENSRKEMIMTIDPTRQSFPSHLR